MTVEVIVLLHGENVTRKNDSRRMQICTQHGRRAAQQRCDLLPNHFGHLLFAGSSVQKPASLQQRGHGGTAYVAKPGQSVLNRFLVY